MIIDMHNHTNISSTCSVLYPEELIETAKSRGLDGICVTEYNTLEGANIASEIGRRMNFPVFRGLEVSSEMGDMLVFGYYKDIPQGTHLGDLCNIVHDAGGVLFAAHPFYLRGGWNLYSGSKKREKDAEIEFFGYFPKQGHSQKNHHGRSGVAFGNGIVHLHRGRQSHRKGIVG